MIPDFQSEYGIDLSSGILKERSAAWVKDRILGLLNCDSRLYRSLHAKGGD